MAQAISYLKQVKVEDGNVKLVLSGPEARVLASVLARISGDPLTSARKHTQAVYDALKSAGIDSHPWDRKDHLWDAEYKGLWFRDGTAAYYEAVK